MLEVEAKVELLSPGSLRDRLRQAGAVQGTTEHHEDVFFAHPGRDFRKTDEVFRLRITDGDMRLTYKGPRRGDGVKVRQEEELELSQDPRPLLEPLGFRAVATLKKTREPWDLDGIQVTIDTVEGLGTFAEVEAVADDEQTATEQVETILKGLGLAGAARFDASYLEMALDAGAEAASQSE